MTSLSKTIALNDYQQLMLRLCHSSPYNAIHAVAIDPEKYSIQSLQDSLNVVIHQLGLGSPELSSDNQHVTFTPPCEVVALKMEVISLDKHIEWAMNTPFAKNEFPLRCCIVNDSMQQYFCITYNHWICDGYSICRLMESIFRHLQGQELLPLTLEAPSVEDCFKSVYKRGIWYYRYLGVIQSFFRFSTAFRIDARDDESTETGCVTHLFEKEVLQKLSALCKTDGITFNDLLMTVLAQLFGRFTAEKRTEIKAKLFKPKRDRIVIGVIANIRGPSNQSLLNVFGLFLGFFYLSFKSPEKSTFKTLSQSVHVDTQQIKQKFAAVKQYLLFKIQTQMWDSRKNKRSQYRLFSKNTPITAGISNMNLNNNETALLPSVTQYIRFSPTAMVCPIVFNLTAFNGYLSLGINFRKTCYTAVEIEQIKTAFILQLHQLVQ